MEIRLPLRWLLWYDGGMEARGFIYGTIAIDTLLTPNGQVSSVLGGSGPYAALAARLVTDALELVGVVGDDFPKEWGMALEARGVSMRHVAHAPGQTFAWTGRYEENMNNRTTVNTTEGVQQDWDMQLPAELRRAPLAVLANVTPPLQYRMLECCEAAEFSMADFMKSWIEREREYTEKLLSRVDLALMNDEEARAYARTDDALEAGYRMLEAGPRYVIVKHGSAGATLFARAEEGGKPRLFRCPAWPLVHPQDPTGAGDAFMGALAGYLCGRLRGGHPAWEDMKRGVALATVTAAAVCEKFGTISLFSLTRDALAKRMADFYEMTAWE